MRYVSHEIRTPLNTVSMGLQVLREELTSIGASEERIQTLTKIESCCEIAVGILNDLLVFDKLDSGILKLDLESLNVSEFLTETVEPFYLQVLTKKLCFFILFNMVFYSNIGSSKVHSNFYDSPRKHFIFY